MFPMNTASSRVFRRAANDLPLHQAVLGGDLERVVQLLEEKKDVNRYKQTNDER